MEKHNRRFAVPPVYPESAFSPAPDRLDQVVCFRYNRKASGGSTISYLGRPYQLLTPGGAVASLRPRSEVAVLCHLDGAMSARYEGSYYRLSEFVTPRPEPRSPVPHTRAPRTAPKPAPDHPWKRPLRSNGRKRDPVDRYFEENWEHHWQSVIET